MLRESSDHGEDLRLVRRVRARDRSAIDDFLRRMRCIPVILEVRNRRLGGALDAALLQDVAQEVLVAIWGRLGRYTGASSLEAWVYRFCVHKHLAAVRNRGRRTAVEAVQSPLLEGALSPESRADADEELVHLALEALDDELERLVRLKHFDELTFEAIGVKLEISPNTAKTRYYRALDWMRDYFRRKGRRLP